MADFFGIKNIEREQSTSPARRIMKAEHHEFAEMVTYVGNIRKELAVVYNENTWLRRQVENLREELRSGDGPSPARVSKEMKTLSSENKELRKEVDKLREELRLAKAGAGPTVRPQVTYSTVRPQAHCANHWCQHHQPPR